MKNMIIEIMIIIKRKWYFINKINIILIRIKYVINKNKNEFKIINWFIFFQLVMNGI